MKKAIWKSAGYLILVLIVGSICAGLEGLLSIFTMHAVDAVYAKNQPAFLGALKKLLQTAGLLVPTTIALAFARGFYKRKAVVSGKKNYISRLFQKNINEFQSENNAKYMSTLTNDVNTIEASYIDAMYEMLISMINFTVAILVIGTVSPLALGLGVVIGGISTLASILISKPLQRHQRQRSELYEDYTAYIKEVLGAFHIIKSNDLGDKVSNDFYQKSKKIQFKGYVIDKIYTYISAMNNLNFTLAFYSLISVTAYMCIKGQLTLGGVILVITNMEKLMNPLVQLAEYMPKVMGTKTLFQKIEETLTNVETHTEPIEIESIREGITFDQVSFGFEDNLVLSEISLNFKKGGKYLVIGPSGGGKSTLLRLLRKYYLPQKGQIRLDQHDLKDVQKNSYFRHIANVEQQVFLFEDTIRNNMTLYKDYEDEEIFKALSSAGLSPFIDSNPEGLSYMLYDNGKNLSGGERSRMAIARALLQQADLLILDEAFSSLDSHTAKAIEKTILDLPHLTVVNVSHVLFEENRKDYTEIITVKNQKAFVTKSKPTAIA